MHIQINVTESLSRRVEKAAAELNISVGELAADALLQKLDAIAKAQAEKAAKEAAEEKCAQRWRKMEQPDGSYFNPDGLPNDDPFFAVLDSLRRPPPLHGELPSVPARTDGEQGAASPDNER